MIQEIAYFWVPVKDMDRAVEFYHQLLGLKLLFKREDWSEFDLDGQRLALRKVSALSVPGDSAVPGISLLARPIEQVIATLKQKGVQFTEELEVYPYGKLASFRDPDGNILGLYEPPPYKKDG
jgi:predicted enzyme related to lactoylglutathione lyase